MRLKHIVCLSVGMLLLFCGTTAAQVSKGGSPVSFQKAVRANVPEVVMPQVDVAALLAEDAEDAKYGDPFRFGFGHEVSYDLTNSGVWEDLDDGGKLWRLAIRCPGAYSINLVYNRYDVPDGAQLFVYTPDRSMVLGAFGSHNNKDHGQFATSPVKGDRCILEYYVPASADRQGEISIQNIVHGYKDVFFSRQGRKDIAGFGSSGDCNINVNCPEGEGWENEVRATAMILTASGSRICSGSLINNVREDGTPYFLSANHCLGSEPTWIIMFNYESPTCEDIDGPTYMTVQGTTLRANSEYSDFALLELSEQPPDSYHVYYAGWSAVDTAADSVVGIHHPSGDIKKISFDDDPVTSTDRIAETGDGYWRIGEWELGTTEGGSSGSPLFDWEHHVIGQLYGGYASCKRILSDWYGQFSESFDHLGTSSTQLKYWLDPDNTGTRVLDGYDPQGINFTADVTSGNVPLDVNFTGSSADPVDEWIWDFGDGGSAFVQSPSYTYQTPGVFDVTLQAIVGSDTRIKTRPNYIVALADTVIGANADGLIGSQVRVDVYGRNTIPLNYIAIPVEYMGDLLLAYDSFSTVGCRTEDFGTAEYLHYDPFNFRLTVRMRTLNPDVDPDLPAGEGPILKLFFTVDPSAQLDQVTTVQLDGYTVGALEYSCDFRGSIDYHPVTHDGSVTAVEACCYDVTGDVDESDQTDFLDVIYLVEWMWMDGPPPVCMDKGDVDGNGQVDGMDIIYFVAWMYDNGPELMPCP